MYSSGSVIGPTLAKLASLANKAVVLVGVIDDQSEMDCKNSIGTLKTMSAYCKEDNLYFPLMQYSNIGNGRFAVDKTVGTRVNTLVNMLTDPYIEEMDFNDKINFLQPHRKGIAKPGVYAFNICETISSEGVENLPGEVSVSLGKQLPAHAVMTIDAIGESCHPMATVAYAFECEAASYYAINGTALDLSLLQKLKSTAAVHDRVDKTTIEVDIDSVLESDIDPNDGPRTTIVE